MKQAFLHPRRAAGAVFVLLLGAATLAGAVGGGNDFYTIRVQEDPNSAGIGLYTAATGPDHPVSLAIGPADILFNGTVAPGQSFTSIRSYTSGTDYTQHRGIGLLASAPPTLFLHDFVAAGEEAIPVGDPNAPSGYQTIYRLGGATTAPDPLLVVQTVEVLGSTFNDSAVKIETSITNQGSSTLELGVRYLWDFRIGSDDGPTFQEKDPNGPVEIHEVSSFMPAYDTYEIGDNNPASSCFGNVNIPTPLFRSRGSVNGPSVLGPTPPTRLDFVAWPEISGLSGKISPQVLQPDAFGYVNSGQDTATCDITFDDSAVAYWWGDEASNALVLPSGGTVTIAAYIFGYLPGDPPDLEEPPGEEGPFGDPTCSDGVDNDGDGLVDGDDPDCAPPNQPPDCTGAAPAFDELWPPNHKMRRVRITGVTDPDGDPVSVSVMGIFQDEPLKGRGDGNSCPDAAVVGGDRIMLRAERSGLKDGRIYHIFFEAEDGQGGECTGHVSVCVPHDRSLAKAQCVDQGPVYDSTGPCGTSAAIERFRNRKSPVPPPGPKQRHSRRPVPPSL